MPHPILRGDILRGRFRRSLASPEPFTPGQPTQVRLPLQDVLHTFEKGHRIMVQVQSTWFPLFDRNPQKYVENIFLAEPGDFVKATHKVLRTRTQPTSIEVGILPPGLGAPLELTK